MMYFFVITFFVAVLALDQYRVEERRNGFLPCIVHKKDSGGICCELKLMDRSLNFIYSKLILTLPGKVRFFLKICPSYFGISSGFCPHPNIRAYDIQLYWLS